MLQEMSTSEPNKSLEHVKIINRQLKYRCQLYFGTYHILSDSLFIGNELKASTQ